MPILLTKTNCTIFHSFGMDHNFIRLRITYMKHSEKPAQIYVEIKLLASLVT